MNTVMIVSEYAERLVREGGVHNDPYGLPEPIPHDEPFEAKVWQRAIPNHSAANAQIHAAPTGVVMVVDVHHADDCYNHDAATVRALAKVSGDIAARIGFGDLCHPDAEPDMWHWTAEPVEVAV